MDIKVNGSTDPRLNAPAAAPTPAPAEEARRAQPPAEARAAGDQATVSDRARLLQRARAAFDNTPAVRADIVEPLRRAVSQGEYRIDLRALVESLMRLVQ